MPAMVIAAELKFLKPNIHGAGSGFDPAVILLD
jgi:hypothetical protein